MEPINCLTPKNLSKPMILHLDETLIYFPLFSFFPSFFFCYESERGQCNYHPLPILAFLLDVH